MSKFSNKWIKPYFNFSKKDRNGIIVLTVLILIVFLVTIAVDYLPENTEDYSEFRRALNNWESTNGNSSKIEQSLFSFNPNTIAENVLDSLLLPEYVKRNLVNYRKAGGKIKTVAEFRKIYGMNDSIFSVIEDYIVVPAKEITQNNAPKRKSIRKEIKQENQVETTNAKNLRVPPAKLTIELNSADSAQLVKLNGVGPVFASRIVKYRSLLGGFYSKQQLVEVYNFPKETYDRIESEITIDSSVIHKIRLNFADFSELLRHPYLNKKQVQTIINYRTNYGALNSVEDLVQLNLIDSVTYIKINPYLSSR